MAWTSPKTWTDNVDVLSATNLNTHVRDNLKAATEWTTYAPGWTATGGTPTIGNDGILTGAYIKAGNLCHFWVRLQMGSTTSVGTTTAWTFSLPATPTGYGAVTIFIHDQGTAFYTAVGAINPGAAYFQLIGNGTGTAYGYNSPMTWNGVNGDYFLASGTFQC